MLGVILLAVDILAVAVALAMLFVLGAGRRA
jgi:hypothetical protein